MGAAEPGEVRGLNPVPEHFARDYALGLLAELARSFHVPMPARVEAPHEHPAVTWASSGLMMLTGPAEGQPTMCPVPLAACADGALAALGSLAHHDFGEPRGSRLLATRAAIAGYSRQGTESPGRSCRLLETADGRIALTLARDDDWDLLPAWLEQDFESDWSAVSDRVRERSTSELVARGRTMGLAVAESCAPGTGAPWFRHSCRRTMHSPRNPASSSHWTPAFAGATKRPRVVDLSALWAGPLCAQLLRACGAEVIKVESVRRPDGAREGPRAFFDLLNAGKASVALDFTTVAGRNRLRELILSADIVVEASRPRALRQLGIDVNNLLLQRPELTWIGITGYGRGEPQENWIAFGDDAGVAAGLSEIMREVAGDPMIVGDAIADPLTGMHAALVAWCGWLAGGGILVDLSLRDVVSHCVGRDFPAVSELKRRQVEWTKLAGKPERPPAASVSGMARPLGADNGLSGD